jgi:hypothetical protein
MSGFVTDSADAQTPQPHAAMDVGQAPPIAPSEAPDGKSPPSKSALHAGRDKDPPELSPTHDKRDSPVHVRRLLVGRLRVRP